MSNKIKKSDEEVVKKVKQLGISLIYYSTYRSRRGIQTGLQTSYGQRR